MKDSLHSAPPVTEKVSDPVTEKVSGNGTPKKPEAERQPDSNPQNKRSPQLAGDGTDTKSWWIKLLVLPLLFLMVGTILIVGLGVVQGLGFISAGGGGGEHSNAAELDSDVQYICPMMCTPPLSEPGRCPVCAMELVPTSAGSAEKDPRAITIDPATRRVANIETAPVESVPMTRTIKAIGDLLYDEGTLKTISAYVAGRLDRLYADYTGVVVKKGDHVAWVYSPKLYSSQAEFLLAKKTYEDSKNYTLKRVIESNRNIYESAKERLIELGLTEAQIRDLEKSGKPSSRLYLCAPISGTVIEKKAEEGQYVKEGDAIYKLADLSTVWLMLELFPEDAALMRYGHKIEAEVQSLKGRKFIGRVAFIDPMVDPKKRTVGVRVVIPNPDGLLRVGDYAKATIQVPFSTSERSRKMIYDPELANKWISPRHPHVVENSPGKCRVCGVELVPASQFGYADKPSMAEDALVVPRNAVLMAGNYSIVYVETEPGRFEIRRVLVGPNCGDRIILLSGVEKGEQVATRGNFLIDSAMQLIGNRSIIDPTKFIPGEEDDDSKADKILASLAKLSSEDRKLAEDQVICPVLKVPLGSMGTPVKVSLDETSVFICCKGCLKKITKRPAKYLQVLADEKQKRNKKKKSSPEVPSFEVPELPGADKTMTDTNRNSQDTEEAQEIAEELAKLSPADRTLAERQKMCPVADMPLGSMGVPIKLSVKGKTVFICCEGCREDLLKNPFKFLGKLPKEPTR